MFSFIYRNSSIQRDSFVWVRCLAKCFSSLPLLSRGNTLDSIAYVKDVSLRNYGPLASFVEDLRRPCLSNCVLQWRTYMFDGSGVHRNRILGRYMSSASIELKKDDDVVRFSVGRQSEKSASSNRGNKIAKRIKKSKKAKVNELKWYRLKARKKMNSPNPEVRIRYKLEKAKRKEEWLIEKLRKFEVPKSPPESHDPESLTEEEKHYLKRTGEKKKNYVKVGRRGVFGGVVLNMHLHWKNHETVKIICKPCKDGQVHEYAEELARLSKGIVIDIKPNNTVIFYRGKNYVRPEVLSPIDTLSKDKALEKYKFMQSLEHTSHFIEKLEKELEEYHNHVARYKKAKENSAQDTSAVYEG